MTQKERIYKALRNAGSKGIRSDWFYQNYLPRASARIFDLKAEGHNILSRPEEGFVRYTLVS